MMLKICFLDVSETIEARKKENAHLISVHLISTHFISSTSSPTHLISNPTHL
jgi:hypothetical protein